MSRKVRIAAVENILMTVLKTKMVQSMQLLVETMSRTPGIYSTSILTVTPANVHARRGLSSVPMRSPYVA